MHPKKHKKCPQHIPSTPPPFFPNASKSRPSDLHHNNWLHVQFVKRVKNVISCLMAITDVDIVWVFLRSVKNTTNKFCYPLLLLLSSHCSIPIVCLFLDTFYIFDSFFYPSSNIIIISWTFFFGFLPFNFSFKRCLSPYFHSVGCAVHSAHLSPLYSIDHWSLNHHCWLNILNPY